ncbi:tRNA (adenosine(37)-N6)-threonylcarbamoyltransferase complex transferase subunit TsaD [Desulfurivibrio alkaliphilus]|uniref:tRNA N6-adenosine threonylcarbamoyltransferase n=1 Tax=Desulfurivibrio alkaliphilus (strain DSM 19089 / UNIQEM U267 / AHT2) TaxID=589865 RepID=D6Z169_DESAT|nr:tRNA (adenosine(37)-N6)-threonylcarbamoyltransferase complex transferase subunit TsaD [Desulfurivibrio alkaliphilus]ADH85324.1 metalloendopeptidase, glycoprotease family [Desulfurivibrio alkaliphilus AHT 2]
MLILGLETSCDDTAAAVLRLEYPAESVAEGEEPCPEVSILANLVQSQTEVHNPYGGVVPELASRRHLENIHPVAATALARAGVELERIDLLAVTQGPGLVGSLLVGLNFAKALSLVSGIPCVGVDHIAGHLASAFLSRPRPSFPYLALTVSGGHSSIFVVESPTRFTLQGQTRDDAAGEAFDKVAKLLHLGYPGGPAVSRLAAQGDPQAFAFPRARLGESFDFSFSGLKTAVANQVHRLTSWSEQAKADICASFQEAVVEILVAKTLAAARHFSCRQVVLSGGVAANPRLRQELVAAAAGAGDMEVFLPEPDFCTDNAAMIAMAGFFNRHRAGRLLAMDVYSRFGAAPAYP